MTEDPLTPDEIVIALFWSEILETNRVILADFLTSFPLDDGHMRTIDYDGHMRTM